MEIDNVAALPIPTASADDPELPAVHAQLVVFASELGQLYKAERARTRDLEDALSTLEDTCVAVMTSLAQVIEAKDACTAGHLDRTRHYGMELARRVDPTLADSPELGYGFFLHDIGKVGIPEQILGKVGPLEPSEWDVMRTHPEIGAQIVGPISFLEGAVAIIRHHHERFDGAGYPSGLAGEGIPMAARIFAVVDSFDAMTSDRPYRSALTIDHALQEVRDGAGTQFDPDVVEVFLDLMGDEAALHLHEGAHAYARTAQAARA